MQRPSFEKEKKMCGIKKVYISSSAVLILVVGFRLSNSARTGMQSYTSGLLF